jgi:hypothetical protein
MTTFPAMAALLLFPAMLVLLETGRRLRKRHGAIEGSSAIEGAIFGLFGLLLAFTFSGAISRYDNHRVLLTQEVSDIGTAYLRLDLLPPQSQPELRRLFRDYTTSRLHLFDAAGVEISSDSARLQSAIWQRSALIFAPASNRSRIASSSPKAAARCSGVSPQVRTSRIKPPVSALDLVVRLASAP